MTLTEIQDAIKQFVYYKNIGDKTFEQLTEEDFFWRYNEDSNNISIIIRHMYENMLSRWTDFLTTDGEKSWRNRDAEFEDAIETKESLLLKWNTGWDCLLDALNNLESSDLEALVFIRGEAHTISEAIQRQLAHYPYHVGQIVFIGKMLSNNNWKSLSIPKGSSKEYNKEKFDKSKN